MRKLYKKLLDVLNGIGVDKYLHFIAGLIIAAIFGIALDMKVCIVPVVFAAVIKEAIDQSGSGTPDWRDAVATLAGGAVIQILVAL